MHRKIFESTDYDFIDYETRYVIEGNEHLKKELPYHYSLKICYIPPYKNERDFIRECIESIVKDNPNIYFDSINYDHKLILLNIKYRSQKGEKLNLDAIQQKLNQDFFHNMTDLSNELKTERGNTDINQISLFNVYKLINDIKKKYNESEAEYLAKYNKLITRTDLKIIKMTYTKSDTIEIVFNNGATAVFQKTNTANPDWTLYSSCSYNQQLIILGLIAPDLNLFEKHTEKFKEKTESTDKIIKSSNSPFNVELLHILSNQLIRINALFNNQNNTLFSIFADGEYSYSINSGIVLSNIIDNEQNILKNIYVNINECPEWMIPYLKQIREDELAEPKYISDNKKLVMENKRWKIC